MGNVVPFEQVLKDGYMAVACVKDYMFYHGDKHYDHKAEYELGTIANVSIVHYSAVIPKADREPMTPKVCFDFCRTVPDMGYFGITNGRDCYCEPYYKQMAGDSSNCDAVCEGEPTSMCGGKDKSSVWGMHMCANTAQDLGSMVGASKNLSAVLQGNTTQAARLAQQGQASAAALQSLFGQAGDPTAADLMQQAKVRAGELQQVATEAQALANKMGQQQLAAEGLTSMNFSQSGDVKKTETLIVGMSLDNKEAEAMVETLEDELALYTYNTTANATKQYYPVMYFVDKQYEQNMTTCGGDLATKPLFMGLDQCASTCNVLVHTCVGFSHFTSPQRGDVCILFSKLKTATYYSKCVTPSSKAKCMVKFSEFEGTTLQVDPNGKCEQCLKEVNHAERCYQ